MTPSGIEPATFRFVAQYLNHCATVVPIMYMFKDKVSPLRVILHSLADPTAREVPTVYFKLEVELAHNHSGSFGDESMSWP
jgi:hypothetical protein